jgi:hypothetical protein
MPLLLLLNTAIHRIVLNFLHFLCWASGPAQVLFPILKKEPVDGVTFDYRKKQRKRH